MTLRKVDIFNYMENEAKKIANQLGKKTKLIKATLEYYKEVNKIATCFAEMTSINDNLHRITLTIDEDKKVIGIFDYKLTRK